MITISLNQIKALNFSPSEWEKLLTSKGGDTADMDMQFPMTDILVSNGFYDTLWATRCLPEHDNLWRKLAVSYARDVQHLMTDRRSLAVLDVAWRHSDGLATDEELRAAAADARAAARAARVAEAAAWDAADVAWAATWAAASTVVWAAFDAAWDAVQQKQRSRLIAVLNAGAWVEVGNE